MLSGGLCIREARCAPMLKIRDAPDFGYTAVIAKDRSSLVFRGVFAFAALLIFPGFQGSSEKSFCLTGIEMYVSDAGGTINVVLAGQPPKSFLPVIAAP